MKHPDDKGKKFDPRGTDGKWVASAAMPNNAVRPPARPKIKIKCAVELPVAEKPRECCVIL